MPKAPPAAEDPSTTLAALRVAPDKMSGLKKQK
jgi:hypothetical protein